MPSGDTNAGKGTHDWLYGGGGTDTFVFGDARGVFYNDGSASTDGRSDYALIKDFAAGEKIQLAGKLSDYNWGTETLAGVQGTSIFHTPTRMGGGIRPTSSSPMSKARPRH